MPYNRKDQRDRAAVAQRLKTYWMTERVPSKAIDQFIEVFNSVLSRTGDESLAFASAYSVVQKRHDRDFDGHSRLAVGSAVMTVGRALAVAVGRKVLVDLERILSKCDCGPENAKALAAVRIALRIASGRLGATDGAQPTPAAPPKLSRGFTGSRGSTGSAFDQITLQDMVEAQRMGDEHPGMRWDGSHPRAEAVAEYSEGTVGISNLSMVWSMFSDQIYSQGDKLFLAVREMLQNSRDAGAKNIKITWVADSELLQVPTRDGGTRRMQSGTLTFEDDGSGMSEETFRNVFMVIGGSLKPEGALGGFGVAKAAILQASASGWAWDIRTRDIHAVSSPDEFGSFKVGKTLDYLNGTKITIPKVVSGDDSGYRSSPMGSGYAESRIRSLISKSDMKGIEVSLNGRVIEGYFDGRRARMPEADKRFKDLDWGVFPVTLRSYKRPDEKGGSIIVRVKGLAQFAADHKYNAIYTRDYVIDFEIPKDIKPTDPRYPFTAGRDAFRSDTKSKTAFKVLVDAVDAEASKKEVYLGEYEEIAPDSSDPREQKAEAQVSKMIQSVITGTNFQKVLENIGELTGEMYQAINEAIVQKAPGVTQGFGEPKAKDAVVEPPVGGGTEGLRQYENPAFVLFKTTVLVSNVDDMLTAFESWADTYRATVDISDLPRMVSSFRNRTAYAEDLIAITNLAQEIMKVSAPDTSGLLIASAISKLVAALESRVYAADKPEVERRKRRGELNPFGGAACIFFSRSNYDTTSWKNGVQEVDTTNSTKFKKNAHKYMKHLAWWDFTVRGMIHGLMRAAAIPDTVRPGIGFVLDKTVLGLCRKDGKFVMINPEALDKVVERFKDRPFIAASFIHGIAAHEIAHAAQIAVSNNGDHDVEWSKAREAFAESTLFLIPEIERAGAKLLGMKSRRGPRRVPSDDKRLAELEAALAEAKLSLEEAQSENSVALVDAQRWARKLQELVELEEFRTWVLGNPALLRGYGLTPDRFLEVISTKDGLSRVMEISRGIHSQLRVRALNRLPGTPSYDRVERAFHSACGCSEPGRRYLASGGHAGCPSCHGTCGGPVRAGRP